MKIKEKMSRTGLVPVDPEIAKKLKNRFKAEAINYNLAPEGFFIGKTLLGKILLENEEAAGILISFGLNDLLEKSGRLQLIIEPAQSATKIINSLDKFATTNKDGVPDPDGGLPSIKPKPPVGG